MGDPWNKMPSSTSYVCEVLSSLKRLQYRVIEQDCQHQPLPYTCPHTHTCTCTCMHICAHTCERAQMHIATMYTHTNGNIKKECLKQPCVQKEFVKDLSFKWRRHHSVIKGADECVVCVLMMGTPVAWWCQGYPGHMTRTGWSDCNNAQPRWLSTLVSSRSLAHSPATI